MISYQYFKTKIKDVKLKDIVQIIPMFCAYLLRPIFRIFYKNTWLICEERSEARDNGYWFFRKIRENHPDQACVYAIDKKSVDYKNVNDLGRVIQFGSFKHWVIYFSCKFNISSQKGGKPNAALCAFIELNNFYCANNIFLQHGVIINDLKWLYADRTRLKLFVTSAVPEKKFIEEYFGYPNGVVQLTGLARFDNLHQKITNKKRIVVMPTWRYWFNLKSKQTDAFDKNFMDSEYLLRWREFLESERLNEIIMKYDLEVIFYPHRNLQNHVIEMKNIIKTKALIASWEDYNLQELLLSSAMMITDYSSVFFDMVYMKKPIIFYQFDIDKFRKGQYEQGYFDYGNNKFGKSFLELNPLFDDLENYINNDYKCSEDFLIEHKKYFPFYDEHNSERIYEQIMNIK